MSIVNIIGWAGSICFAICATPTAYESFHKGHSRGLNAITLWLWFIGEVCTILYILFDVGWNGILMFNYLFNLLSLCVILKYKYWERNE